MRKREEILRSSDISHSIAVSFLECITMNGRFTFLMRDDDKEGERERRKKRDKKKERDRTKDPSEVRIKV